MSELLYERIDALTAEVARLNDSVQKLTEEERRAHLTARLMVATQIYFQTIAATTSKDPKDTARNMPPAIDGILMVDDMVDFKRKQKEHEHDERDERDDEHDD